MEHILASFRQSRGPLGRETVRARSMTTTMMTTIKTITIGTRTRRRCRDRAILKNFQQLFDLLLRPGRYAPGPYRIRFDAVHLREVEPDRAKVMEWLRQLIESLSKLGVPPDRRDDIAAANLMLVGDSGEQCSPRWRGDAC